jgi:hypothetical protein
MEQSHRGGRILDWAWFVAFGLASSAWCLTASGRLGATFDEPLYVDRGLEAWRTGSHNGLLKVGTMPLPVDVETLPLYLWERWHGTRLDPEKDLARVLPWARAGTLVFWWLLLFYARLAGRQLAGPWGGRLAVAMLACEPSLLAHASLATTDLAVSACLLALVYHFRTGREGGWLRRVALPTFWYAAAVSAKASGLVFGPLCLFAVELERLARSGALQAPPPEGLRARVRHFCGALRPLGRDAAWIITGGLALVFVYCSCDWQPEPSFVAWAHRLPDGRTGQAMVWLAEHLRIFSNAGNALARQISHNVRGHGAFLLGQTDPRALWYYFPVLLTMKLTLPLLVGAAVLAVWRPRALLNWAGVAAAMLIAFSLTCRVQIGIRLVLPLVALGVVGVAGAVVRAYQSVGAAAGRRVLAAAAGAGILWSVAAAWAVWPHGLCYLNEFWGGTEAGYQRVSETNYDWGQGLKDLARWQKHQGLARLDVWYFGTDPSLKDLPLTEVPLHALPIRRPQDVLTRVRGHYLAVSTTLLYGPYTTTDAHRLSAAFLRGCRPADRTRTFLIYDFTGAPAADPPGRSR